MSQSNETRKPAARPSLLSAEQQVALEQHPVAPLASPAAAAPAPAAARRKPVWLAVGVAVLAGIAALAATQFGSEPDPAPALAAAPSPAPVVTPAPAPATAPTPAAAPDVPAAAATPAVLAAALDAPQPQTATIIDEAPSPAAAKPKETLAQMLEGGAAPASKSATNKTAKKPVASKPAKPAAKSQSSTPAEPDNDVALLAALVAHAKYDTSANARLSLPKALEQCKKQGKQDAARCRIRVCEGRWKKDECRVYSRSKLEKAASGA